MEVMKKRNKEVVTFSRDVLHVGVDTIFKGRSHVGGDIIFEGRASHLVGAWTDIYPWVP